MKGLILPIQLGMFDFTQNEGSQQKEKAFGLLHGIMPYFAKKEIEKKVGSIYFGLESYSKKEKSLDGTLFAFLKASIAQSNVFVSPLRLLSGDTEFLLFKRHS